MANSIGKPLAIIFLIANDLMSGRGHRRYHDVLPLIKLVREVTQKQTLLLAHSDFHSNASPPRRDRVLTDLFGTGSTFPKYLNTPAALRLRKVYYNSPEMNQSFDLAEVFPMRLTWA